MASSPEASSTAPSRGPNNSVAPRSTSSVYGDDAYQSFSPKLSAVNERLSAVDLTTIHGEKGTDKYGRSPEDHSSGPHAGKEPPKAGELRDDVRVIWTGLL